MLKIDVPGFEVVRLEHLVSGIHVTSANIGLDLLLHPKRMKATLRF
jgi:hypothetical protein